MADRRQQFVTTYLPYAQQASAITGIDPGVILAQAAHETGWGRKAPGNNFFGIKGKGQAFATHEYIGGKRVNMKAGFRRYDSPLGSFLDWAKLMQTPRYAGVLAAKTPEAQIKALKAAGYATDPLYVSKLRSVRNQVSSIAGPALTAPAEPAGIGGIMDVASRNDGTGMVPDQPTAAQGFAPNLGAQAPAQQAIADMLGGGQPELTPDQIDQLTMVDASGNYVNQPSGPPMPAMPPQWASAQGFPIDESLTGASAQATLMGGPRMDPRRAGPATGPMPPDMGAMRSPADVLNAGPNLRPSVDVPMPTPPPRPTGPGIFQRNAVSGAPDAGSVPMPPPRASGIPDPPPRPDINDPSLSFNAPPYAGGGPTGGPPMPAGMESMVAGRPEFPGALPAAPPPAPPGIGTNPGGMFEFGPAVGPGLTDFRMKEAGDRLDASQRRAGLDSIYDPQMQTPIPPTQGTPIGNLNYSEMPEPPPGLPPMVAGRPEFPGGGMPAAQGPFFDNANPGPAFTPPPPSGTVFDIPPSPFEGTTGENFTPTTPMPSPQPDMMADRFNDAFSPGGGGQIMDLQTAFDQRNAPPTMSAQDGINSIFGAPPAQAAPPNLAIPFAEVPGFDPGRFQNMAPPSPAGISMDDFDARFAGGSVVNPPTPQAGVTPGVVSGEMPQPMDIRPPIQGGPPMPEAASPLPAPAPAPRQTSTAPGQRSGIIGRILGGLLGGPLGAMGGGLLGGGGGGGFGFGGQPSFTATGGGTAPYGDSGGSTTYQKGTSNALGGSNALSWTGSKGQTITAYTDPNTGQTFHSYG